MFFFITGLFSDLFHSFSKDAYDINVLFIRYLIFAASITFIIGGVIITSVIRFSARKDPSEPIQVSGNNRLEIVWTILPLVIVTFFLFLTLQAMNRIDKPIKKNQIPDIVIIGKQWWWELQYKKENIITANELHILVGKLLLAEVESDDVIHDWWVPDLGPKIDAVPGHPNYTWISADKPGIYLGACSEYCGTQHAWMRIRVIAQNQEDYANWIRDQQNVIHLPDSTFHTATTILAQKSCLNCHSISVDPKDPSIGPNLSHLGSRQTLLSGRMVNTKENLIIWLKDPQMVKQGALMPDFMFTKNELNNLSMYLEELK